MSQYSAPVSDMNFLLFDVFEMETFWQQNPVLAESIDVDTAKAILEESAKVTEQALAPFSREADETGVSFKDGSVTTPASYKEAFNVIAEGGWIGLAGDPEYGGMGMPKTLAALHEEMMCSADLAFALYPGLTAGACLAIRAHASDELKEQLLPNMYSGQWAGSMCLTESHAGTDLGLIKTKAIPLEDGSYEITGSKIFISGGEQDLTENIIHLVLAKLPDAPAGSRGISLFAVSRQEMLADGSLGDNNGVTCGSIEHKMGIHGSATCVINFDQAKGQLIGEVNKGLACMFTMMNYERLLVGLQGLGAAERSYQNALAYAKDRGQGKGIPRLSDKETDPIIVHPDVRRMLLTMKAMNEGARAFTTYVSKQLDISKFAEGNDAQTANAVAQLLTPIAKAFVTDTSFDMCVIGQQVFGGHGYVREWGQEQLVRDTRITQIYEGTNGVQALDLLGRKVAMDKGQTALHLLKEVEAFIKESDGHFSAQAEALTSACQRLLNVTNAVLTSASENPNEIGAASVDYLHMFGYVMYGYMWLKMMNAAKGSSESASFVSSKLKTGEFYFSKLLPKVLSLEATILAGQQTLFNHDLDEF